ncbi:MAG TPA: HAD-IC family P-type ATPase [Chthonomonadaceae bacterium]|nr:HAD-IC family P-type ATPase [Chthonomonadaceae bacterium]
MPAPREVIVAHDVIPGRTRFRIQSLKTSPTLAQEIADRVGQAAGVDSVELNRITGSVLVFYDPAATGVPALKRVIEAVLTSGLPMPADAKTVRPQLPALPTDAGNSRRSHSPHNQRAARPARERAASAGAQSVSRRRSASAPAGDREPEAVPALPWHTWTIETVAQHLETIPDRGLTAQQVALRTKHYGRNEVPDIPRRPRAAILQEQFLSLPSLLLSAATTLSAWMGAITDALFIGGAILLNAAIGFFTEDYAERTIQSLRQTRTPHARVLREGRRVRIPIEEVVPGDILLLEPGHVVAADGRVLRSDNLVMDESLLTGETAGQAKEAGPLEEAEVPLAERANMVYAGSAVASGKGAALVTATGLSTELGRIRTLIGGVPAGPPPMTQGLERLGGTLALGSMGICAVFGVLGLLFGLPALEILALVASLAVSAIPEGLPTVSTLTLALGMKRMRAQNVVIRRLPAVATLGSVTILCADKTGTLTENRMRIRCFVLEGEETEVAGAITRDDIRFFRQGQLLSAAEEPLLLMALQTGALCTQAELHRLPTGEWDAVGSPTEKALLLTAVAAGVDVGRLQAELVLHELQERAPGRNYMVSIHHNLGGSSEVFVKGAPEEVLALCSHQQTRSGSLPLTPRRRKSIRARNERLAARGLRVLGLAHGILGPGETWHAGYRRLEWIGLVGMEDPVRAEAGEAIERLAEAGIRTLMLTGDQRVTAEAVGRSIRLGQKDGLRVAEAAAVHECLAGGQPLPDVLARVTPEHKYEIVRLLQEQGHVVMMTGDGINDAPALRAADVGITLGMRSTQIARDLADVILLDDNLMSLPAVVGHGRTLFANIRKALRFLICSNLGDIALVGAALLLRRPPPLTALQLLWINLVTDIFPALALAMEPADPQVMQRGPRPPQEPLLTRSLWQTITWDAAALSATSLASYLWGLGRYGPGTRARTAAFTTLTMAEIAYALACRSEPSNRMETPALPNRYLAACVGLSTAAQVGAVTLPPLRRLLGTTPLSLADWVVAVGAPTAVLGLLQAFRRLPPPRAVLSAPQARRALPRPASAPATPQLREAELPLTAPG